MLEIGAEIIPTNNVDAPAFEVGKTGDVWCATPPQSQLRSTTFFLIITGNRSATNSSDSDLEGDPNPETARPKNRR